MSSSNLIFVESIEGYSHATRGEALLLQKAFATHTDLHPHDISLPKLTQTRNNIYFNPSSSVTSLLSMYPLLRPILKLDPAWIHFFINHPIILRMFRKNPHILELLATSVHFLNLFVHDPNLFFNYILRLGLLKEASDHNKEVPPADTLKNKVIFNATNSDVINLLKNYQQKEGMLLSKEQIISRSNLSPFSRTKEGNKNNTNKTLEGKFNIEYKSKLENITPRSKSSVRTTKIPNLLTNKAMQQENIANLRNYAALFMNPVFLAHAGAAAITTNKGKIIDEKINEPAQELREPFELERVHEVVATEFETIIK